MRNRAQIIVVKDRGSCSIVACGEALEIRTAISAELGQGTMTDLMPPVVRALSPTVTVCQNLPRGVSFSRDAWRSTFRRKNKAWRACVPMSRSSQKLWYIDDSMRPETRSVSSDLFLENGAEGIQKPVTACHTETGDWRWVPWRAPNSGQGRRPAPNRAEQRPLPQHQGDRLATEADRTATLDGNRRQISGSPIGAGGNDWLDWRRSDAQCVLLEDATMKTLMAINGVAAARVTHVRTLMQSRSSGSKASETTTKNDTLQNPSFPWPTLAKTLPPADSLHPNSCWPHCEASSFGLLYL